MAGQTAALALKKVKRGAVRKGMVLVDASLHPKVHTASVHGAGTSSPSLIGARPAPLTRSRGGCAAQATYEFSAEVSVLTHSTTIQPRYQAVIHCEIVRQVSAARPRAARMQGCLSGRW